MADPKSYIGATLSIFVGAPATYDAAGFAALSWSATLGKIASIGQIGDESEAISVPTLEGRTYIMNGSVSGGEIPISFLYDPAGGSAAVAIINANKDTNNVVSLRIIDPDSKVTYLTGYLANFKDNERGPSSAKGYNFVCRATGAPIRVSI